MKGNEASRKQQVMELLEEGILNQTEIAKKVGMTRQGVSFIKNDKPRRNGPGRPPAIETQRLLMSWLAQKRRFRSEEMYAFIKQNNIGIAFTTLKKIFTALGFKHYNCWEKE